MNKNLIELCIKYVKRKIFLTYDSLIFFMVFIYMYKDCQNCNRPEVLLYSIHRKGIRQNLYIHIGIMMARFGYKSAHLSSGTLCSIWNFFRPHPAAGLLDLHNTPLAIKSNRLPKKIRRINLNFDCQQFFIDDIDVYPLIHSSLSSAFKRNTFDWESNMVQLKVLEISDSIGSCLDVYERLHELSRDTGERYRIIISQFIDLPNNAFKFFCDINGGENVQCIALIPGLGKYYFGDKRNIATYIISNLTKRGLQIGVELDEDQYKSTTDNLSLDVLKTSIDKALLRGSSFNSSEDELNTIQIILDRKKDGSTIYCLYGHLFYDLACNDVGYAFNTMQEWMQYTVNYFKKSKDILLVKPHPSEGLRWKPNESIESFIRALDITPNIVILDPLAISNSSICKYIDCGLVWTSSVGMELSYLGVPCVIAGKPVYKSLKLNYAISPENYRYRFENYLNCIHSANIKKDVAAYLYYQDNCHSFMDELHYYNSSIHDYCLKYRNPFKLYKSDEFANSKIVSRILMEL